MRASIRYLLCNTIWLLAADLTGCADAHDGARDTEVPGATDEALVTGDGQLQGLGDKCLDIDTNVPNGQRVQIFACNGGAAQRFHQTAQGELVSPDGRCLDVVNGDAAWGKLQLTACNGTAAQKWHWQGGRIYGLGGGCLDVLGGNPNNHTEAHLTRCNGTAAQQWTPIGSPRTLKGPGDKCLDVVGGSTAPGARLQIYQCNNTDAQQFVHTTSGEIVGRGGQCLDVLEGDTARGIVQMTTCNGTAAQKWRLDGATIHAPGGRCLDVEGGSSADHTSVHLYDCNRTVAQQWTEVEFPQPPAATLLIVTSDELARSLAPLVAFKTWTGIATKLVTVSELRATYPGADDPEILKRAIEHARSATATRYVMLAGNAAHVPARYRATIDAGIDAPTVSFNGSDLYYANLYRGHFAAFANTFDTWDLDGNEEYDAQAWSVNAADYNPDGVDGYPDVAVGRVPAANAAEMSEYVRKVIQYESTAMPYAATFTFVESKKYPGAIPFSRAIEQPLPSGNHLYLGINYGPSDPLEAPWSKGGPLEIELATASSGWIFYVGDGFREGWDGYDSQASLLANQKNYPIVFAAACQTGKFIQDVTFVPRGAPKPSSYASPSDGRSYASQWLFGSNHGGAIAYFGQMVTLEDDKATALGQRMMSRYAAGDVVLGDIWRGGQDAYYRDYLGKSGGDPFREPRIYLGIMGLYGDPSLRVQRGNGIVL